MSSDLDLCCLLDPFVLQSIQELLVNKFSIEVVIEDVDEKSQNLGHKVSKDYCDRYKGYNYVKAFNRIFWSNVSISNGCSNCDSKVHDVNILFSPGQKQSHLVIGPSIVNPAKIGSIWTVVVIVIYPKTSQIESNSHIV